MDIFLISSQNHLKTISNEKVNSKYADSDHPEHAQSIILSFSSLSYSL